MSCNLKIEYILYAIGLGLLLVLAGCAAERQGVVCDEIEYRLNTMTYSPDQRAYAEEELRVCREEEAQKKGEAAAQRQSIYDRFAAKDSSKAQLKVAEDGSIVSSEEPEDVSVSKALKDSSGEETMSIYERYGAVDGNGAPAVADTSAPAAADTSAADVGSFQ